MRHCCVCDQNLKVVELGCPACGLTIKGDYQFPRLLRLSHEAMQLAETLILAGGNLKTVAEQLDISYPTLRKRVDELTATLAAMKKEDENKINDILASMESGKMPAQQGIRLIKEVNGEL